MINLDRFSRPLEPERLGISSEAIEEQRNLNKHSLVFSFIDDYVNDTGELPDVLTVQDALEHIYLSSDLIKQQLNHFKE
jgi:hypothetical protein